MLSYRQLIDQSEDYIEAHLGEKITLTMLAQHLKLSKYYYHHLFKHYRHKTIKDVITQVKMERSAIYLVVNRQIKITDVAFKYGYSDASAYNKAFKKYFKVSPTQYRKARNDKQ
jgi:AraC family of transcriptional regulator, multidrug resistance transcriptional activator